MQKVQQDLFKAQQDLSKITHLEKIEVKFNDFCEIEKILNDIDKSDWEMLVDQSARVLLKGLEVALKLQEEKNYSSNCYPKVSLQSTLKNETRKDLLVGRKSFIDASLNFEWNLWDSGKERNRRNKAYENYLAVQEDFKHDYRELLCAVNNQIAAVKSAFQIYNLLKKVNSLAEQSKNILEMKIQKKLIPLTEYLEAIKTYQSNKEEYQKAIYNFFSSYYELLSLVD